MTSAAGDEAAASHSRLCTRKSAARQHSLQLSLRAPLLTRSSQGHNACRTSGENGLCPPFRSIVRAKNKAESSVVLQLRCPRAVEGSPSTPVFLICIKTLLKEQPEQHSVF